MQVAEVIGSRGRLKPIPTASAGGCLRYGAGCDPAVSEATTVSALDPDGLNGPDGLLAVDSPVDPPLSRRAMAVLQVRRLVRAIRNDDDATVEAAVLQLSQSHRYLAPLAFVVGAFVMLFVGLKLLFSNWRLTLVQVLPAMWIWIAMVDLKMHVLHGRTFYDIRGMLLVLVLAGIAAITAASFFLNAVFAFAIVNPDGPQIRPAFARARSHLRVIVGWGLLVGFALGMAAIVVDKWGDYWFAVTMSIVVAFMTYLYVAMPSRFVGYTRATSKKEALKATMVGGALGATICSPPYIISRIGMLMLGSSSLFIPGLFVLTFGLVLQAGATSSVKAIKLSAKLVAGGTTTA